MIDIRALKRRVERVRASWKPGLCVRGGRPWIQKCWSDMVRRGVPEERVSTDPVSSEELELRRQDPMIELVISMVESELAPKVEGMVAVSDAGCCLLTVGGEKAARYLAKDTGLDIGFIWNNVNAGCNGIGTAVEYRRALQIFADEHWCMDQRALTCTVAPVFVNSKLVAAINITEDWRATRRSIMFLLTEFADKVQREIATTQRVREAQLTEATRLVELCDGPALVIDKEGHVLAARDVPARLGTQVDLPRDLAAGVRALPRLGLCLLEPVPDSDGWLVRLIRHDDQPTLRVILDFSDPSRRWVRVRGTVNWDREVKRERHAEVLRLLHRERSGLTAAALAGKFEHGNPNGLTNVRTLMCGIRNVVGPLFESRPYRFGEQLTVELLGA